VSYFYSSFFCFLLCIYLAHFNIMICLPLTFVCYLGLWDPFSVFTKRKCMQLNYFNLFYLGVDLTSPRGVLTSSRGVRGHAPPGRCFFKCWSEMHQSGALWAQHELMDTALNTQMKGSCILFNDPNIFRIWSQPITNHLNWFILILCYLVSILSFYLCIFY